MIRRGMKEYTAWLNMKSRCNNPKNNMYKYYGGRGIKVSDEFKSFDGFISILGKCHHGYSLDRINNNGNYEPGNVRWADEQTQKSNRSDNVLINYNNKTQTLTQWSREIGISMCTLWNRINKWGWSIDKSLTTPIMNIVEISKLGAKARWHNNIQGEI